MVATIPPPDGKAIFTTDGDITINGFSFSGVHVADQNGAGIRMQTGNLVISDCYFHDNEMGILNGGNSSTSTLTIDDSEFAFNGAGGAPGIGHNLYVGNIDTLIVTDSYFHDATVGHEIKSRAANTTITNCRIFDLNSNASYSVDLPNGGNATITGNVIEQGPNSENSYIIEYGGEGMAYASNSLVIDNNVILNDKTTTLPLLFNASSVVPQFDNNEVFGPDPGATPGESNRHDVPDGRARPQREPFVLSFGHNDRLPRWRTHCRNAWYRRSGADLRWLRGSREVDRSTDAVPGVRRARGPRARLHRRRRIRRQPPGS